MELSEAKRIYGADMVRKCERCEEWTLHESLNEKSFLWGGSVSEEWQIPDEGHYCFLCENCNELTEEVAD